MISLIFYLRVKGRKIKAKWVIVTEEKINWNECNDECRAQIGRKL